MDDRANVRDRQLDLHQAAAQGLERIVRLQLDAGAPINAKNSQGFTPLYRAVQYGHEAVVRLLLDRDADIEARGPTAATPLHLAMVVHDVKMARILLDRGANIEASVNGFTPLFNAIASGDENLVQLLLERGANAKARVQCASVGRGETVLHMAVALGNDKLLPLLIQRGVYVDERGEEPAGQTALHIAASYGNEAALQTLLDWGADVSARYQDGQTALHQAAANGRLSMVNLLLSKGIDALAESNEGETALCRAAIGGNAMVMEALLRRSGDAMSDAQKARALVSAAKAGKLAATKALIARGFPVAAVDASGVTALDMASYFGHRDVVAFLRNEYTNPFVYGAHIQTSMTRAAANGHSDIVQLLREPRSQPIADTSAPGHAGRGEVLIDRFSVEAVLSRLRSNFSQRWVMPAPGGYPASCYICQDLNFRRGASRDAEVAHYVPDNDAGLDRGAAAGCPGCSIVRQCVKHLESIYEEELMSSWKSPKSITLQSLVDGGPLLVSCQGGVSAEFTLRAEIYSHLGSPTIWPVVGPARTVSVTMEERMNLIRSFVQACTTSHTACSYQVSMLPTRVLDVGSDDMEPRLYVSKGESARYATLSHSWGGSSPISTETATLSERTQQIRLDELPKTFRDAVVIARSLGIRYLWIDSLCILQDDAEDWEREAAKMSTIYENCYLMIAADESKSCHTGCFSPPLSDRRHRSYSLPCEGPGGRSSTVSFRLTNLCQDDRGEICHRLYDPQNGFSPRPLDTRGWTLQERLLAPRIVHLGRFEVGWECATNRACECQMVQTQRDGESRFKARFFNLSREAAPAEDGGRAAARHLFWINVIREFSRRQLTRSTDVLPALSGLASRMGLTAEGDYICGMWRADLVRSLMWKPDRYHIKTSGVPDIPRRAAPYCAPSWSWASIIGPVEYAAAPHWRGQQPYPINKGEMHWGKNDCPLLLEVLDAQSELVGPNPFGTPKAASLTVRGYTAPATFHDKSKSLPHQSSQNGGALLSITASSATEGPAGADLEPDVSDEHAEASLGDLLHLLFVEESEDSWEGHKSRMSSGEGIVLRQTAGDTGTYSRVGTFRYQGAANWKEWRKVRTKQTLRLI